LLDILFRNRIGHRLLTQLFHNLPSSGGRLSGLISLGADGHLHFGSRREWHPFDANVALRHDGDRSFEGFHVAITARVAAKQSASIKSLAPRS
jgi:hypothetical protein